MSLRKAWLLALLSFLDEFAVLALVFLGLWLFHVEISWWIILIVVVVIVAFGFIMHKAIVPAIRHRKVTGADGMIGLTCKVTESLKPSGTVKIKGEYWKASVIEGEVEIGEDVEVVGINGLDLKVRKKRP